LLKESGGQPPPENGEGAISPVLFIAALGESPKQRMAPILFRLRKAGIRAEMDYADRSLKAQMRQADRLGARYVLIVGENEIGKGSAILRNMQSKDQEEIPLEGLSDRLAGPSAGLLRG